MNSISEQIKQLESFLKASINSVSREALLAHRFMYDMTLAAALREYALLSFTPSVDRDGVDLVLSDHDNIRHVQLKSTTQRAIPSLSIPNVHGSVLKPQVDQADRIGFEPTQGGSGQGGVVILMEVSVDTPSDISVRYWLTDAYVLVALSRSMVPGAPKNAIRDANALIQALQSGSSTERVDVPVSCFLPTKSPAALLGIGGWHAPDPFGNHSWQYQLGERLRPLSRDEYERRAIPGMLDAKTANERHNKHLEKLVSESLSSFITWPSRSKTKKKKAGL